MNCRLCRFAKSNKVFRYFSYKVLYFLLLYLTGSLQMTSIVLAGNFETFLEPAQMVDISTPFRDRIDNIHVQENDHVQKGTLLAELASKVLQAHLQEARIAARFHGEIDSAHALLAMRKDRLHTLENLQKTGNVRPLELSNGRTELAMAKAQLQSALDQQQLKELEIAVIKAQVQEKKLVSPLDGVVIKIFKQNAKLIGGNDLQPLLTIAQLNPLHAVFHLPPAIVLKLQENQSITLKVNTISASGIIDFIAPIIDAKSGTRTVRIRLPNPDSDFLSGSRCSLTFDTFSENQHDDTTETTTDKSSLQ